MIPIYLPVVALTQTNPNYQNHYISGNIEISENLLTDIDSFDLSLIEENNYNILSYNFGNIIIELPNLYNQVNSELSATIRTYYIDNNDEVNVFENITHFDYSELIGYNISFYTYTFNCIIPFSNINNLIGNTYYFEFHLYNSSNIELDTYTFNNSQCNYIAYDNNVKSGYDEGYRIGYDDGYQIGATTETNLNRLILSIPDTFVQSFYTIFNFEIFGVNISIFIISIISVGIIIWLLKKVGGK